ncbi:MAG: hypothetical protein JEY71_00150 [Sphaerochaeta sp.]|nr:hypothetical protein [Sphaerochaeta sp.]
MRKIAPLLLALMFLFSVPAQEQVRSNSIGQDRGRFSEESEYTLSTRDSVSTLEYQGELVWRKTLTRFEEGFEISTYTVEDGTTHKKRYENNRLVSEGVGEENRYYYYDERGLLEKTMVLLSEKLTEMELYTYDVSTHSLNAVLTITEEGSSIFYFGNPIIRPWFSYRKGKTFTKVVQISQNLQIQEVWVGDNLIKSVAVEMTEEGGIRLRTTKNGIDETELYNDAGLLVLRISPSLTTEYWYNEERILTETVEKTSDDQVLIRRYEGGRVMSESQYMNDILEKETLYPSDSGKVETLYDNGQPYCDISYALDGKRVLSIRYR